MNQNDANMIGARGIRVSCHPDDDKVWITPTHWSIEYRRYVAYTMKEIAEDKARAAHPALIGDLDLIVDKYVGREEVAA